MEKWLSTFWQFISNWLSEMGSAHVADDGMSDRDEALKMQEWRPETGR